MSNVINIKKKKIREERCYIYDKALDEDFTMPKEKAKEWINDNIEDLIHGRYNLVGVCHMTQEQVQEYTQPYNKEE